VRWIHPDGVRVAGAFFEVVEELGLVDQLTHHLLAELTDRRLSSSAIAPLPISVNVAPDHLRGLIERYEDTEVLSGLMLEITEQARFVENVDGVNRVIARARAAGARVLLDDFGVGFSSLARAARLDVDGYKLDRIFIAELATDRDARAVMAGVAEIASRQGREVIAEGVETMEQASILADFGVATAQGFLYSPAVSFEAFEELLAGRNYGPTPRVDNRDRIWH
ncbi:MAG: EAL domain-containing protein, partial [Actinomycetota bacterium]